ncbi:MAG: MFS transporter [Rhodospirillales bacterium]|nr:MFS transporter [Rhodospirillales bacterium]MBO6787414.1 MFS transporter [Rhodospirillales bacterium]
MTEGGLFKDGWRSREVFLVLTAIAMPISFSTWQALFNNFAHDVAGLKGDGVGFIQSFREVPGFLSFTVIMLLVWFREQRFALASLVLLGIGTMVTGFYPSFWGLMMTTFVMSVGFHYFESLHQSLTLQWIDKKSAPEVMGKIVSARSFAALISFGIIWLMLDTAGFDLKWVYLIGGGVTVAIGFFAWFGFPEFKATIEQSKKIVIRKRYWLWYALVFMSGARRQIFVVFAGFLMVQKFGFSAGEMSLMFLANMAMTIYLAPKIGRLIGRIGERRMLIIEYTGLVAVFTGYAFASEAWMGVALYIIDHVFFAMAIAIKTYFQKIADPADIASSSGVSFTISHIVAIVIPAAFGFLWLTSPAYVFLSGTAMAAVSLVLAFMVPRDPEPGNESLIFRIMPKPQPAE